MAKKEKKPKKEKKEKRGKKEEPQEEAPQPAEPAENAAAVAAEPRAGFSALDPAVLAYFTEVQSHLRTVEDAEERSLLAANALEETQGESAAAVTSDPACSRVLETLLDAAPAEAVCKFAGAVLANGDFLQLATHPIASHVMERLLTRLGSAVEGSEAAEEATEILLEAANGVAGSLYGVVTDKVGSHVARRLLSVAAGRDVSPGAGGKGGLAGKVETAVVANPAGQDPALPQLLQPVTQAVLADSLAVCLAEELVSHPHASPFLQSLIIAMRHDRDFLEACIPRLLGAGEDFPASVPVERVHGLMQDRTSSHLMEVLLQTHWKGRRPMQRRFLEKQLAALAEHPIANFVVQSVVASVQRAPECKWVAKELAPALPQLLKGRRGGVVAAAVAMAVRTGIGYKELAPALSKALQELPHKEQGPAAALLSLDQGCPLAELPPGRRLSPLGCIILISLLRFPRELAMPFTTAVAELEPEQLARAGRDPGGSRALETLLTRSKNAVKPRKKVLQKLARHWGSLAGCAAGSFVIERAYTVAQIKDKETIAEALALANAQLAQQPWGPALLSRCGVEEFKRNSDRWRQRTEKSAAVQAEFEELLGDGGAAAPAAASEAGPASDGDAAPAAGAKRAREEALSEAAIFDLFQPQPAAHPAPHKKARAEKRAAAKAAEAAGEAPAPAGGGKAGSQRAKTKARLKLVAEKKEERKAAKRAAKQEAARAEAEAAAAAKAARAAAEAAAAAAGVPLAAPLEVFEDRKSETPKKKKKKQKKQKLSKRAGDKTNPLRGGVAKPKGGAGKTAAGKAAGKGKGKKAGGKS